VLNVFGARVGPEELAALEPSVTGGWMGMGPRVEEFERAFSERLGREFVMTNSGTAALHVAVEALELPPRSDVVLPAFTWVGCAHAVALAGHRPVFCDVDLETQNAGAAEVERARTPATRALMVVDYAGKPARIGELEAFGLPVIEDAAHAVDSKLGERRCGALTEVGVFSFDAVKNLATPDGGGLACAGPELAAMARRLRYCGIGGSGFQRRAQGGRWWEHDVERAFPRALPNDVSASVGLAQLARLDANQRRRRELWERYREGLAGLDWLRGPADPAPDERHSYFTYLVRVVDGRRDALARELLAHDIYSTLRYQPLHLSGLYRDGTRLPASERLAEEGLNLPLHPGLSDADLERILGVIHGL
jgi:dTDP-4-amino-4,6-dideoxygalactose transaminase